MVGPDMRLEAVPRPGPIKASPVPTVNIASGCSVAKSGLFVKGPVWVCWRAMRSTKIVATIGPSSKDLDVLEQMIRAGMDVARLNFAHGTPEQHGEIAQTVRAAAERAGRDVAILGDLPGPKLRIGPVAGGVAELARDSQVVLTPEQVEGTAERLPVAWDGFADLWSTRATCSTWRTARCGCAWPRCSHGDVVTKVEVGGQRRVAPGPQPAERDRLAAGGERGRHRADRRWPRHGRRLLRALVRAPPRGSRPCARAPGRRASRGPADREDREATGGRERRGDHPGGRRHHDRPRRPRHRAADRGGPSGAEATARRSPGATRSPRSPPPRCSSRWCTPRDRRERRWPTWPTRSSTAPTP